MSDQKYVWAIAYINRDSLHKVEEELKQYEYEFIDCYVPTVRMLKKKFKGKDQFEFLPLLFNYGFFKIPYEHACNPDWLISLRSRIECIYGWVKDPTKAISEIPHLRSDNKDSDIGRDLSDFEEESILAEYYRNLPQCALATDKEVNRLKKSSDTLSVFSEEDIDRIKEGDHIILKGYPFENIPAEVLKINKSKKFVQVRLDIESHMKTIKVSFENVFYTVYSGDNPEGNMKEQLIEDINLRNPNRSKDSIYHNIDL